MLRYPDYVDAGEHQDRNFDTWRYVLSPLCPVEYPCSRRNYLYSNPRLRVSNTVCISASLHLRFQKYIYILDKENALTRVRIVSRDDLFLGLKIFNYFVTILHGHSHFIDDPRTYRCLVGNRLLRAFAIGVPLGGSRLEQAEQELVFTEKSKTGW